MEKEYYIFLFDRILLCCKEAPANISLKKKKGKEDEMMYVIKGNIFITAVSDVKDTSRPEESFFELKVYWREMNSLETFNLKCRNIEQLNLWKGRLDLCIKREKNQGRPFSMDEIGKEMAYIQDQTVNDNSSRSVSMIQPISYGESVGNLSQMRASIQNSNNDFGAQVNKAFAQNRKSATNVGSKDELHKSGESSYNSTPYSLMRTNNSSISQEYLSTSAKKGQQLKLIRPNLASDDKGRSISSEEIYSAGTDWKSNQTVLRKPDFPRSPSEYARKPSDFSRLSTDMRPAQAHSRKPSDVKTEQLNEVGPSPIKSAPLPPPPSYGLPQVPAMNTRNDREMPRYSAHVTDNNVSKKAPPPTPHKKPGPPPISALPPPPPVALPPAPPTRYNMTADPYTRSDDSSLKYNHHLSSSASRSGPFTELQRNSMEARSGHNMIGSTTPLIKVKTYFGTDIFILAVSLDCTFIELTSKIENKIRLSGTEIPSNSRMKLKYKDDDGDFISISGDDDLSLAFQAQGGSHEKPAVTIYAEIYS